MKGISLVSAALSSTLLISGLIPFSAKASPARQIALVGDFAYALGDSRSIPAGRGVVKYGTWTKFGNAVVFLKFDIAVTPEYVLSVLKGLPIPSITESAYLWNRKTNQTQLLERVNTATHEIYHLEALPNERTVLIFSQETSAGSEIDQLRIVNGTWSEVISSGPDGMVGYAISGKASQVLVWNSSGVFGSGSIKSEAKLLDVGRGLWRPVSIELKPNQFIGFGWFSNSLDGFLLRVLAPERQDGAYLAYSPNTGKVTVLSEEQFKHQRELIKEEELRVYKSRTLFIDSHEAAYPDGKPYNVYSIGGALSDETTGTPTPGLAKPEKRAYFAAGADDVELSPGQDAVLIHRDGTLSVQDILRFDRSEIEKIGPETRDELMLRAKQVAVGLQIYASDNDDELPPAAGLSERIMPYIRSEALIEGFIYTYNGPLHLQSINDPSSTELGFIRGDGGSAVIYADGSVRWKPDP